MAHKFITKYGWLTSLQFASEGKLCVTYQSAILYLGIETLVSDKDNCSLTHTHPSQGGLGCCLGEEGTLPPGKASQNQRESESRAFPAPKLRLQSPPSPRGDHQYFPDCDTKHSPNHLVPEEHQPCCARGPLLRPNLQLEISLLTYSH